MAQKNPQSSCSESLEATIGFEPMMRVLQTRPLISQSQITTSFIPFPRKVNHFIPTLLSRNSLRTSGLIIARAYIEINHF